MDAADFLVVGAGIAGAGAAWALTGGPDTGAAYLLPEIEVHPGAAAFYKKHGAWRDEFGVRSGS